jgi:hypothetical protein
VAAALLIAAPPLWAQTGRAAGADATASPEGARGASLPPEIPAAMRPLIDHLLYIDGRDGNDTNRGESPAHARKSLPTGDAFNRTAILLRRGTRVALVAPLQVADGYVGAWGPGSERPTLYLPEGISAGIVGVSGLLWVDGIAMQGSASAGKSTNAVMAVAVTRVNITNNSIHGFFNGIKFAGEGGLIADNDLAELANNGMVGGQDGYPAPSRTIIRNNTIDATGTRNDAITLHNGEGLAYDNQIIGNVIKAPGENCVDIVARFHRSEVRGNTCTLSGEYSFRIGHAEAPDGADGTRIIGNTISNSQYAAIRLQGTNAVIESNHISNIYSAHGANVLLLSGSAEVRDNDISVPATNRRAVFNIVEEPERPRPRLTLERNRISNLSNLPVLSVRPGVTSAREIMADCRIDGNHYESPSPNLPFFDKQSYSDWRGTEWGGSHPRKDSSSTLQISR